MQLSQVFPSSLLLLLLLLSHAAFTGGTCGAQGAGREYGHLHLLGQVFKTTTLLLILLLLLLLLLLIIIIIIIIIIKILLLLLLLMQQHASSWADPRQQGSAAGCFASTAKRVHSTSGQL